MPRRWRSPLLMCLFLASILAGSEIAFGSCIKYPREAETPTVEVCEHADSYSFRIGDHTRGFLKDDFARQISSAARVWLSRHGHQATLTRTASIQIWMSIPMANPEAAQPRALIETSAGLISFWFDLNKLDWEFDDNESAILGADKYPASYGHRPASVLVQAHANISTDTVERLLHQQGATSIVDKGNGVFEARCKIFDEKKLVASAAKLTNVIKYAQVNSVMEWIADRQMAFAFTATPE